MGSLWCRRHYEKCKSFGMGDTVGVVYGGSAGWICSFGSLAENIFSLGNWVLIVGIALGICSAIGGLVNSLKILDKLSSDRKKQDNAVSFNDHD